MPLPKRPMSSSDPSSTQQYRPPSSHIKSEIVLQDQPFEHQRGRKSSATILDDADDDVDMASDPVDSAYASNEESSFETMATLGENAKRLVDAVSVLENAGVEAHGLPLPKIVAVGDQSSGKSSLIEAISAIRVPRSSNTCTRCPIQISLTNAETTSYKVTVHKKYMYHPQRSSSQDDGSSIGIGPWSAQVPEDLSSRTTEQEAEVKVLIERAQIATLCPSMDPEPIMQGRLPSKNQCEFSPNVVKLEVTGPTLPTLMMYDLPGIITQSHTNDDSLPALIKQLAEEYIENPNTIVVLACPIGSDHVNSLAAKVVKDCAAESRTVGVITKPDKLDMADYRQWYEMLAGEKFKLGYGYFVTKQLGADDTFRSHKRTRDKEAKFFQTDKRWTDQRLRAFSDRFGTPKLQAKLAELLAQEIAKGLPVIQGQLNLRIQDISGELQLYPKPTDNAYSIIISALSAIEREVQQLMSGENGHKKFMQDWKNISESYDQTLKDMKPALVVNTGTETQWQSSSSNPISLDSDDEDEATISTPSAGQKRTMNPPNTPSKRQRGTPSTTRHGESNTPRRERTLYDYPPVTDTIVPKEHAPKWTLDFIRESIRNESTSGIPRATDPAAEDALIKIAVGKWDIALHQTLAQIKTALRTHVLGMISTHLRKWESTALFRDTLAAGEGFLDQLCAAAQELTLTLFEAKKHKPFTLNVDGLDHAKGRELASIRASRHASRRRAFAQFKYGGAARRLDAAELDQRVKSVKDAEVGEDPFAREIAVAAEIRGYYTLAAANMVDTVGELVLFKVFHACARDIGVHVRRELGLEGAGFFEEANKLLAEDPAREQMRAKLEAEQARLGKALEHLQALRF